MADQQTDQPSDSTFDAATGLTGGDLRRAALTTCGYATDVDDARELLEALGLVNDLRSQRLAG